MTYPDGIDALVNVNANDTLAGGGHAARHNSVNTALEELADVLTVPATDTLALVPDGTTERFRIDSAGLITGAGTSLGAWTAYTPVLTATTTNPTLGTSSIAAGLYVKMGKIVVVNFRIIFGSSGVDAGSGEYRISVPFNMLNVGNLLPSGVVWLYDVSAGVSKMAGAFRATATPSSTFLIRGEAVLSVGNATPWTWAAGDTIAGTLTYEEA
jgi:hypothetical protein